MIRLIADPVNTRDSVKNGHTISVVFENRKLSFTYSKFCESLDHFDAKLFGVTPGETVK